VESIGFLPTIWVESFVLRQGDAMTDRFNGTVEVETEKNMKTGSVKLCKVRQKIVQYLR
jgi:hypothetical protein